MQLLKKKVEVTADEKEDRFLFLEQGTKRWSAWHRDFGENRSKMCNIRWAFFKLTIFFFYSVNLYATKPQRIVLRNSSPRLSIE